MITIKRQENNQCVHLHTTQSLVSNDNTKAILSFDVRDYKIVQKNPDYNALSPQGKIIVDYLANRFPKTILSMRIFVKRSVSIKEGCCVLELFLHKRSTYKDIKEGIDIFNSLHS